MTESELVPTKNVFFFLFFFLFVFFFFFFFFLFFFIFFIFIFIVCCHLKVFVSIAFVESMRIQGILEPFKKALCQFVDIKDSYFCAGAVRCSLALCLFDYVLKQCVTL